MCISSPRCCIGDGRGRCAGRPPHNQQRRDSARPRGVRKGPSFDEERGEPAAQPCTHTCAVPVPFPPPPLFPGGGGAAGIAERKGALNLFCNICKVGFMANCPRVQLQGHIDSKHPKNAFADAFPDFVDK